MSSLKWEEVVPGMLHAVTEIEGLSMHVTAIAVHYDEATTMQEADAEEADEEFARWCAAGDPDGPYMTVKLDGYEQDWVLFCDPYCD